MNNTPFGKLLQVIALAVAQDIINDTQRKQRKRRAETRQATRVKVATTKKVVNEEFTDYVVISSKPLSTHGK